MAKLFKKIGVFYNIKHSNSMKLVETIIEIIKKQNIEYFIQGMDPASCAFFRDPGQISDVNIFVGGDGTLLCGARNCSELGIPILGINSGNLGFLSQLCPESLEQDINMLFEGNFRIEERLMIEARDDLDKPTKVLTALNDIVIKHGPINSPLILSVSVGEDKVNDFLGDGLIVSTPTGSTAYNLSVGGPIITPGMNAMVISPISSHSLAIRPIVIPDDKVVKIKMVSDNDQVILSSDGQEHLSLEKGAITYVVKSPHKAKLVLLNKEEDNFFKILKSKLHWGIFPGYYHENNDK